MASALLPWRPEVVDLASDSSKSSKAGAACGSDNGWRRARQEEASGGCGHGWEEGRLRTRPGGRMQAEAGARTGGRRDAAAGREQASAAMGEENEGRAEELPPSEAGEPSEGITGFEEKRREESSRAASGGWDGREAFALRVTHYIYERVGLGLKILLLGFF